MSLRLTERERDALTCPYCHDDVRRSSSTVACDGCAAHYHRDCFDELGRCGVLGCQSPHTSEVAGTGWIVRAWRESVELTQRLRGSHPFSVALLLLCCAQVAGLLIVPEAIRITRSPWVFFMVFLPLVALSLGYGGTRAAAFATTWMRTPRLARRSRG